MLGGAVTSLDQLASDDYRRLLPWWQEENLATNQRLVDVVSDIATARDTSLSQVALAWVLAQGDDVVPIPGTKRRRYLQENLAALDVELSDDDLARLDALRPSGNRVITQAEVHRTTIPARCAGHRERVARLRCRTWPSANVHPADPLPLPDRGRLVVSGGKPEPRDHTDGGRPTRPPGLAHPHDGRLGVQRARNDHRPPQRGSGGDWASGRGGVPARAHAGLL